jgi:hypothetical protein
MLISGFDDTGVEINGYQPSAIGGPMRVDFPPDSQYGIS